MASSVHWQFQCWGSGKRWVIYSKVRVFPAETFASHQHGYYDVVVLQNTIITPSLNLVSELFKIKHGLLITTLVPGYIMNTPFFPFIVLLEKHVLR